MLGTNEITKPFPKRDGMLLVNSFWYTMQGEGPDAGRPAIFMRLSKCNLRCTFCDTEFESGEWFNMPKLRNHIMGISENTGCKFLVITGGEPLLQNVVPLIVSLNERGISVSIETAGTVYAEGLENRFAADRSIADNLIVCSPKTPKLNARVIPLIGALKYVIGIDSAETEDGLPAMSTQVPGQLCEIYRPCECLTKGIPIYIQPMDTGEERTTRQNVAFAAAVCMRHNYRLSLQMHKVVGLD